MTETRFWGQNVKRTSTRPAHPAGYVVMHGSLEVHLTPTQMSLAERLAAVGAAGIPNNRGDDAFNVDALRRSGMRVLATLDKFVAQSGPPKIIGFLEAIAPEPAQPAAPTLPWPNRRF